MSRDCQFTCPSDVDQTTESTYCSPFGSHAKVTDATSSQVVMLHECQGNVCADPPDWCKNPLLDHVAPQDRCAFRETKITEWMEVTVPRGPCEKFCEYLVRCIATAENVLKREKKLHIGDDFTHHLDKLVFKLFYGIRLSQHRYGVKWPLKNEELIMQLLREECGNLVAQGLLPLKPKHLNMPSTSPWPNRADTALHEAQRIPPGVDTWAEMDSR